MVQNIVILFLGRVTNRLVANVNCIDAFNADVREA